MAQLYTDFKVLDVFPSLGQIEVIWYNGTLANGGAGPGLETPIGEQYVRRTSLLIPIEAEENDWTYEQLRDYWIAAGEVADIADIPQWAIDEVGKYTIEFREIGRKTPD